MTPQNAQEAQEIVQREVIATSRHDLVLRVELTEEHDFGWVVYPAPRKFLESRHARDMIPGLGPIAVTRGGEVVALSTSVPPQRAIAIFAEAWQAHDAQPD